MGACRVQRGYVLLATLGVMAVLSLMLSSLSYQARVETAIERHVLEASKLRAAARGAVHTVAARLRAHARDPAYSGRADWSTAAGLYRDQALGDSRYTIHNPLFRQGPVDERPALIGPGDAESRLNVNLVTREQLMGLPGFPASLADAIVSRRESLGGEAPALDPENLELIAAPFRRLRDLTAIPGVDEEFLFGPPNRFQTAFGDHLTAASTGRINVNTASREVLQAIGFTEQQADILLSLRRQNKTLESHAQLLETLGLELTEADAHAAWQERLGPVIYRSYTFNLEAEAWKPNAPVQVRIAAAIYTGGERLTLFRWHERTEES